MDRKEFFRTAAKGTLGCCALALFEEAAPAQTEKPPEKDPEKEFTKNWMEDLFDSMYQELDEPARVKVMAGCGRGCFRRFQFKQGDLVHVRYGAVNKQCYCPAARYHPVRPHDMHCECTRATHQTVFETALGRPIKVEIVDSLRRGGPTCHFVAHVA